MSAEDEHSGVVVHLDEAEPAKHDSVLTNIANLRRELGAATPVELVVHGPGVDAALATGPQSARLVEMIAAGLTVSVCANTMNAKDLSAEDLVDGAVVVPAGVAQLVRRQRQGWSYLRP